MWALFKLGAVTFALPNASVSIFYETEFSLSCYIAVCLSSPVLHAAASSPSVDPHAATIGRPIAGELHLYPSAGCSLSVNHSRSLVPCSIAAVCDQGWRPLLHRTIDASDALQIHWPQLNPPKCSSDRCALEL